MTLLLRRRQRGRLERLELKAENGRPTESQLAATAWCRPLHQEPRSELKDVRHAQQCSSASRLCCTVRSRPDQYAASQLERRSPFTRTFRGLALSPSHTTLQLAVALVESIRRPAAIAGFPLSAWAFALRIWAAMMVALYAAFWLQLESASSAAVTVGILALQTRGQAYQKAVYRILCTIIGVVASFAIAGLFAQSRELFVLGIRGMARALRLRRRFSGWQQGVRRRPGRLHGRPGRGDADRLAGRAYSSPA